MKVLLSIVLLMLTTCGLVSAQQIREQDISYRTTIVREINLNHPSNQSLFGKKALLAEILLDYTLNGSWDAYNPEDHELVLSRNELIRNISFPEDSCGFERYHSAQLYLIELQEEFI